ncbi:2'-5' RNA ligase [Salinisphaera sp. PC39]|uniref:RNA 2',3'-cyclic phosphodiesterase n=1 Tax=Salinisphaera sp. PC39 TaxID=1304156 RepID=UPI00333F7A54
MPVESRRLFFALWPPRDVADEIAVRARDSGVRGRLVPPEKLHLTLAFLGDVPAERIDALLAAGDGIRAVDFDLCLSRLGYFRGPRAAWVGPKTTPAPLAALAAGVREAAAAAGIGRETRGFRAHVTVARRAEPPRRVRLPEPVAWRPDAFELTESARVAGKAVYRPLRRWPLAPASVE